jgi:hypothetical protein
MSYDYQPRMKDHPAVGYLSQLVQHSHCYPVYLANFRALYKIMTGNSVMFRNPHRAKRVN